jgi:predicted lipoprotein with Yx(FWY)xxD motif
VAAGAVLLLASCGGGGDDTASVEADDSSATPTTSPTESPTSPAPSTAPGPAGTRLVVRDSDFGPMLFDARGQAIYLFDVETSTRSECYGDCAEAWPPVLTDGTPVAGKGVRADLLGTTRRRDGAQQVTYGGHPLYFYAHEGPGEVECHDVFLNGGTWYVVTPEGKRA